MGEAPCPVDPRHPLRAVHGHDALGTIKSAIGGTYRKIAPDHAERYLASFAWRYNRRYQLQTMIPRFVHSAARTQRMPHRILVAG